MKYAIDTYCSERSCIRLTPRQKPDYHVSIDLTIEEAQKLVDSLLQSIQIIQEYVEKTQILDEWQD